METKTCTAPVNIAVVKYWGKRDEKLVLPVNSSVSVTLHQNQLRAKTSIAASKCFDKDRLWLNGREERVDTARIQNLLNEVKQRAESQNSVSKETLNKKLHICSENNFPTAAGLASSAAGYACLAYTLAKLYRIEGDISDIARRGSGSACRSVYGGFVVWEKGQESDGSDSIAWQLAPESHWPQLRVLILVVSDQKKSIGSSEGMQTTVTTSQLMQQRVKCVQDRVDRIKEAILNRDFEVNDQQKSIGSSEGMQTTVRTSQLMQQRVKCVPDRVERIKEAILNKDFEVSDQQKSIGSSEGMQTTVRTSQLMQQRVKCVPDRVDRIKEAILNKDFEVSDQKKSIGSSEGMQTTVTTSQLMQQRVKCVQDRVDIIKEAILNRDFEVSDQKKAIGSSEGMQTTIRTSQLMQQRVKCVPDRVERIKEAILNRDFEVFGEETMKDSNQLHAVCLDTYPPISYHTDTSRQIMALVHAYNKYHDKIKVAYTYDAGPNACLYLLEEDVAEVVSMVTHFFPPSTGLDQFVTGMSPGNLMQADKELLDTINLPVQNDAIKYMIYTKPGPGPQECFDPSDCLLDENGMPLLTNGTKRKHLIEVNSVDEQKANAESPTRKLVKTDGT